MLAGHLTTLVPALTRAAVLEFIRIHRGAGRRLRRDEQAREPLAPIYAWFIAELDTADLQEAQTLAVYLSWRLHLCYIERQSGTVAPSHPYLQWSHLTLRFSSRPTVAGLGLHRFGHAEWV
jgi:hypothetical protein